MVCLGRSLCYVTAGLFCVIYSWRRCTKRCSWLTLSSLENTHIYEKKIILPICLWNPERIFLCIIYRKDTFNLPLLLLKVYIYLWNYFYKTQFRHCLSGKNMYYKQHLTVQYFEATYISPSMNKDGKWSFTSQHQRLNLTILKSHWAQTQGTTLSEISLFLPGVK